MVVACRIWSKAWLWCLEAHHWRIHPRCQASPPLCRLSVNSTVLIPVLLSEESLRGSPAGEKEDCYLERREGRGKGQGREKKKGREEGEQPDFLKPLSLDLLGTPCPISRSSLCTFWSLPPLGHLPLHTVEVTTALTELLYNCLYVCSSSRAVSKSHSFYLLPRMFVS